MYSFSSRKNFLFLVCLPVVFFPQRGSDPLMFENLFLNFSRKIAGFCFPLLFSI